MFRKDGTRGSWKLASREAGVDENVRPFEIRYV